MDLQEGPRPDMAVAVMSATLEISGLRDYMGASCPGAGGARKAVSRRNRLPGSPAGQRWTRQGIPPPVWEQAADAVKEAVKDDGCGDVLVFMPGVYEIRKTAELLAGRPWMGGRTFFLFTER